MVNKNLFLGFFPLLMLSVLFLLSSKNVFFMWVSMELNMLSVLPILGASGEGFQAEVVLKYFLVQAWGSLVFIWATMSALKVASALFPLAVSMALLLKVGAAPFHLWFISIMKTLDWKTFVLMSTVQKAIPLFLLFMFQSGAAMKLGISFSCLATLGVSSVKFLKKVMAISSIFSLAWLLMGGLGTSSLWLVYLGIYTLGLVSLVSNLEAPVDNLSLSGLKDTSWGTKLSVFLAFVVLAGLPPFVGFYGKLLLFAYGLALGELVLCGLLLSGAVWMMFIYVRSSYPLLTGSGHSESGLNEGQLVSLGSGLLLVGGSLLTLLSLALRTGVSLAREILNFKDSGSLEVRKYNSSKTAPQSEAIVTSASMAWAVLVASALTHRCLVLAK